MELQTQNILYLIISGISGFNLVLSWSLRGTGMSSIQVDPQVHELMNALKCRTLATKMLH